MNISKGLYEVITSKTLSLDQKLEAIPKFAWPIHHLDGYIEQGEITEEDADLICEALREGDIKVLDLSYK